MVTMTSRIGSFAHDSKAVAGPDGFLRQVISALGIERSRVAVYGLEHVLPILGESTSKLGACIVQKGQCIRLLMALQICVQTLT